MKTQQRKLKQDMSEYEALRSELLAYQDRKINIWLQMYALFLTLFGLALSFNNELYLLTYVILIPYQFKMNNMEWNVSRLSAYIRIFYEEDNPAMNWESFNTQYIPYKEFFTKVIKSSASIARNCGPIHLGCLASGFFIYSLIAKNLANGMPFYGDVYDWVGALVSIALLVFVFLNNKLEAFKCEDELVSIIRSYKDVCEEIYRNDLDTDN